MPAKKPKIRASSMPILCELDWSIREYNYRGAGLFEAASDLFDSWLTRRELDDLIRRRFLLVVKYSDGDVLGCRELCGSTWSVDLTKRAIRAFWPERA